MRGKYQFWLHLILILSLIISTALIVGPIGPVRAQTPRVYVDPPSTTDVTPDNTFTVYVRVQYPVDLKGFDFKLKYKTSVLTTTSAKVYVGNVFGSSYMETWREINDTVGYVWLSVINQGSPVSAPGPFSLARIIFTVESYGGSCLSLSDTSKHGEFYISDTWLSNSEGEPTPHEVEDGHFVNSPVHDIAITSVTPSSTSVILGQTVTVNVTARNHGYFPESFTVTAYANTTIIGTPQPVTDLAPGSQTTLTFTWDTTGVPLGKYIISATAPLSEDTDTTDNTFSMTLDFSPKPHVYAYVTITVIDYPTAAFTYSPISPVVNEQVTFDASDSTPNGGYIKTYQWDFGDGNTTGAGIPTAHNRYVQTGTYTVALTVTDSEGLSGTTSKLITVYPERDVAVINVETSATQVILEQNVDITVIVKNNGKDPETFDVTAYYDSNPIGTQTVTDLPRGNTATLTFTWNTAGVPLGIYTIKAVAELPEDEDQTNNEKFFDGTINVVKPPVADFTYSPPNPIIGEDVTFDASASTPNGGTIDSYAWDFDDGATGTGITTTHAYTTPGTYTVTLTITDSEGLTDTESKPVTITAPIASFTYSPIDPYRGQDVTFDASASTPSRGTIVDYAWDFESDGTIDVYGVDKVVVTHTYTSYADYLVTLKITDSEGLWDTATDTVHVYPRPPIAQFTYSPKPPKANIPITFNASESNDPDGYIVSYIWNFSDGTIVEETDNVTTHMYLDIGAYSVNLTVIDDEGLSGSIVKILPVGIPPPTAYLTYSPMSPVECEEITFDASKSSSYKGTIIVKYMWDFGDGSTGTGVTTTHTYLNAGSYTVNLTVTDNSDPPLSGSILQSVVVGRGFIEIEADVGTIHFVGEKAEFYLLVKFLGKPVDATEPINAKLYYAGTMIADLFTKVEHVDTGLYRILWDPIPDTASSGTYTVLIQASYFTLKDSTIKSFLISEKLTQWNAWLKEIKDNIVTIVIPNLGQIKANLTEIKATLVRIEGTVGIINSTVGQMKTDLTTINATLTDIIVDSKGEILAEISYYLGTNGTITVKLEDINATLTEIIVDNQGEILAKIDSAIGSVTTTLDAINAKVVAIDGNVATIKTDVGTIKTTISAVQTTSTTPLYVTSVFSVVAAIIALIVLFILRRKPT